tara:strand:+ start:6492 stop:6881 length:390 start_codon:yes stop_codon:yes gene_type:complete
MNITHTDIEIYIKSVSPEAIKAWLETCTSSLDVQSSNPKRQAYWATFAGADNQQAEFEIIVLNKVQSNFSSVWFNTKSAPWANDKACAQEAFGHFQSTVRCVASSWQEGDAPDQWLSIDAEGEQTIDWL